MALASSIFDTGITWKIKDKFAMLLERLSCEDLCKEVRRIRFARKECASFIQLHAPSAAQFAHLEQLRVYVAGVGGSGIAMTQIVRGLAVCANLYGFVETCMAHEIDHLSDIPVISDKNACVVVWTFVVQF